MTEGEEQDGGILGEFIHDDLFGESRERPRLTRQQKRVLKRRYLSDSQDEMPAGQLEHTNLQEMQKQQEDDPMLDDVKKMVSGELSSLGNKFFRRDGVIYRR